MLNKFLSKEGAEAARVVLKFFSRSGIYSLTVFLITIGCQWLVPGTAGIILGAAICVGLLVAVLFYLYER